MKFPLYPQYLPQQSQLQLKNNSVPSIPIRPQLPAQPNPNSNNKVVHQLETVNMPAYSLSPIPCNEIRLRSGKIVEPIITEDVSRSGHKETGNSQHPFATAPIIEYAEHPLEGTAETSDDKGVAETSNDKIDNTQPSQLINQPPYPERLMLPRTGGEISV